MNRQNRIEAAERASERRKREDDAPRLKVMVSDLATLKLEIGEYRKDGDTPQVSYTKHVVVERAPALFQIGCSDSDCADGGHDLTRSIMAALRVASTDFNGEDSCYGRRQGETCGKLLRYRVRATYASTES